MMRFLLPLLVLGSVGAAHAARPLLFTVEASRLRVSDSQTLVEYYVTVDGTSVRYARTPAGFEARVAMTVTVADSVGGIRTAKKYVLRSPTLPDTTTATRLPFRLHERLGLSNGRYTLAWVGADQVRGPGADQVRLEMPLATTGYPARLGMQIADIQLLESFQKTSTPDAFTKGDYALEGRVTNFYPAEVEYLKFYTEIYRADAVVGAGQPLSLRYRVRLLDGRSPVTVGERRAQQPAAATNVVLAQLNLAAVPSGNCELLVEVLGKDDKVLVRIARPFQRSNPGLPVPGATDELAARATATSADELRGTFVADLDSTRLAHYLLSLRPVTTAVEAEFVQSLARSGTARQQRAYLYHFWKKQSATEAAGRWAEYLRRIEYVDGKFANTTFRAYETDQGRVYLQYGPPDQVFTERTDPQRAVANSDGRPYQIWNYYKLKNLTVPTNQTNRTFVFFQRNLGDPSPRLIHSNAISEASDPNWRTVVSDKFSGRARFDRNAGSGGQ
ncbi:MAG: GWxTD domain-containing protein [Hymenobacteraceae bacterium]|nr:GWxTD domain-containing protein [Hymenobacteraceae bacterium]